MEIIGTQGWELGPPSVRIVMICIIHCIAGWLTVAEKTSGIHCPKEPLEVMLPEGLAFEAELTLPGIRNMRIRKEYVSTLIMMQGTCRAGGP